MLSVVAARLRFQLYLGKDQKRATHVDCSTPFGGMNDVLRSLVPFHVFQGGDQLPGVMEHGLFIGLAQMAIVSGSDGIRTIER